MPRWPKREPAGDPNDPRGWETLMARYVEHLGIAGSTEATLRTSGRLVRMFAMWCCERDVRRPADVSRSLVERYQRWLYHYRRDNGRPLAFKTQQQRLSSLKGFFRFLARERYVVYNPASEIVLPKPPPRLPVDGFTVEEMEQILSTPDPSTPLGLRDRAILETFYSTAIRRSELVNLDLYDIGAERGWLTIRQGKGGRDRVVPIGERALAWVARYLEEARPRLVLRADEWAVFLTAEGERFSPVGLTNHVRRILRDSGVRERRGSCHLFRHTCATLMLEGGADLRFLQEMLGHASPETTQIYTKVSIGKLQEIHAATHPAARLGRHESSDEPEPSGR